MDWRVYHSINTFVAHHSWLGRMFHVIETYGTILIGVAAVCLWLLARPGGGRSGSSRPVPPSAPQRSDFSSTRSSRRRGTATGRSPITRRTCGGRTKTDASFPSDHSSAAFGIAVAVALIDPLVGAFFIVLAVLIAVGRVVVGEHYPGDVIAGAAIGTMSAFVVIRLARPVIALLVRLIERATDPVLALAWRRRVSDR